MPIATGVFKKLSRKRQLGVKQKAAAGAAGSARYMRRVTSTLDLAKASYGSAEVLPSQQRRDSRHGVRSVAGTISGELSIGAYQPEFESVLRQNVQVAATTGAVATISATTDGVGTFTGAFARSAGSFLADGFKVGDVVRPLGWTTGGVGNNGKNFIITALTAVLMTVRTLDKSDVAAKVAGDNVTIAVAGKKTWIPAAGHTRDYYTIEHFFADLAKSEQFVDCVYTGFTVNLPPTGMATVEFPVLGLNMEPGNAEYFAAPAAAAAGGIVAAVNGVLISGGLVVANVTGLSIVANGNYSAPGGVVGDNVDPDIFPGPVDANGQFTALFSDTVARDAFLNETEMSLIVALTENNLPGSGVICFAMSRVKYNGATKDDGVAGLTQTVPYVALERVDGAAEHLATTLSIQDTAFI